MSKENAASGRDVQQAGPPFVERTTGERKTAPAATRRNRREDAPERHLGPLAHIRDLTADPANRRKHNARNIGMVVDSLHKVGAARSIVIDEHGTVLAGNGTVEAAAEAGITRLQVVDADGETIIAVRRRGLTAEQKRALALFDNRSSELADWDISQLQADADAGLDLNTFFEPAELADLLGPGTPVPGFEPVGQETQGRLDQLKPTEVCPRCGHAF